MGPLTRDLRHGLRQLLRRPGFSFAAVGSLALGIGLTTTLFSVVNAVLLRDSPIVRPDRLVEIYSSAHDFPELTTSYPDYLSIKAEADALQDAAAHSFVRGILSTGDRPLLVTGESVTANYFEVLGIPLARGRAFRPDEDAAAGAAAVAVLSHGIWQRSFGGREDLLGTRIDLSGRDYAVIGIAPPEFRGTVPGIPTGFWVPVTMVEQLQVSGIQATSEGDPGRTRLERRGTRWLFVKGRLAEGRTVEQARSQVQALFGRLEQDHPETNERVGATVHPASDVRFHPMLDGYIRAASGGLLAAVGLVLLIACANVASMLLARGTARRRELAVRAALGAGRLRLVRQLLSEGLLLAGAGGLAGTLIAMWASRLVTGVGAGALPVPIDFGVSIDGAVLAFAVLVSLVTVVVFGLAPAWSSSRLDLVPALKESAGGEGGRRRITLRDALVVGQLALSLVLLVAGALLARGLLVARGTDIGFDPSPVASLSFNLQMNGYDVDRAMAFRSRALESIGALPGVEAASIASRLPLAPDINMEGLKVPGHHSAADDATPIDAVSVGADYFRTVGVPIVAGRAFTADDVAQQRPVAVVNETMARRYWPDGSALGRRIHPGDFDQPALEIVGIARDHKVRSVGEDPRPYLHTPAGRSRSVNLLVRTSTDASAALPMLREALWQLEPNIVFTEDQSAADIAALTMAPTRIGALLIGSFAALALVLAAFGLYGVIAYSVSLRTREVGIRMALGAGPAHVLRTVLAQGGRLALVGVALGTLASFGAGQVLASLLYGVSPFDPVAYGVAAGVLLAVAALANLAPAIGAARIDPLRALRRE
jgi:predicted permease